MENIPIGPETDGKRIAFFQMVFGRSQGYVCLAFMSATNKKQFHEEFYRYPEELEQMNEAVNRKIHGNNVYFCPQLLQGKKRAKEEVVRTPNVWADLDFCHPNKLYVEPSIVLETSPRRFQGFWLLDKELDPDDAEDLSRRIAYRHADDGCDRSGWDLSQLLRVPFTYNYKYTKNNQTPTVKLWSTSMSMYRPSDFSEYPDSPEYSKVTVPMPEPEDFPEGSAEDLLQSRREQLNPRIWGLFTDEPQPKAWSQALWNLEMLLFETGFTRTEVYKIVQEAKCNKYARDGRPAIMLWKDVVRAEEKAMIHHKLLVSRPETHVELLSDEERAIVDRAPDTFIERYIEWASSLGDAAQQYHQAGAFVTLSSLLAGSVKLPTSYGTIIPNLWFMILADTTLTRKSTAMDIAMELVEEVDADSIMATDGSLEGLLTTLSQRPGKPSVFLRDEFSGLLEQMVKKDYMAGMAELLTKLYDGKMQKRVLRKEVIECRNPRLIFFAGGIKNKITSLLTDEHVSSGFLPRFVFITAESDLNRVRPIGPPQPQITGERDAILAELQDVFMHYNKMQTIHVPKLKQEVATKVVFEASMSTEAWIRYNELESQLMGIALKMDKPDIMTPVGDRLAKSILKAALLIAASRQRAEEFVTIEMIDLLRAIRYGEQWRTYAQEIMDNVGKGSSERHLDAILRAIKKSPTGASRSMLMQAYHMNAREASQCFETLEQRGLITRQKAGRTELLLAVRERSNIA